MEKEFFASNPAENANFISQLFFLYMFPIFKRAYKYELTEDDLFKPLDQHKSQRLGTQLEKMWYQEFRKHKKSALHRSLFKMFGVKLTIYSVVMLVDQIMLIIVIPMCIFRIVSYFEMGQTLVSKTEAYIYSAALVACIVTDSVMSHPTYMGLQHTAMKFRVACTSFLYRKMLKFSRRALMETTVGQLVNLLSNDVSKFDESFMLAPFVIVGPLQVAVGTYLLYREIGFGAFYGVGFLVSFVPFQILLAHKTSIIRLNTAIKTDERVRLMNEMLSGIQVIKFYCWEKPFSRFIKEARRAEVKQILYHSYVIGLIYSFEIFLSRTSVFLSILGYVLLGNYVRADKVFAITSIFDCLRPIITMLFSLSVSAVAQVHISMLRIQSVLAFEERQDIERSSIGKPGIRFENVYARWVEDTIEDTLINVNFDVSSSRFFAIIGPVGGGKSSIFNVILKELPTQSGNVEVAGTISYSSQEPWLFSSTVRDNILFGEKYNALRYKRVLYVCALKRDLDLLPFGDRTQVGERGRALSGGQRARVSLARCIYKVADIYLLDDPLSAVDATVGKHIYVECIRTFLSDAICVLITHQLQFLKDADRIMIIDDGEVQMIGSYEDIRNTDSDFTKTMQNFIDEEEKEIKKLSKLSSFLTPLDEILSDESLDKEEFESGSISMNTYWTYFKAGGNCLSVVIMFVLFVGNQLAANGGEYYLTYWVNMEQDYAAQIGANQSNVQEINRNKIIVHYTLITIGMIMFSVIKSIYFMTYLTIASRNLHDRMYSRIQCATMRFFDVNPSGRILNRFSKDLGKIDEYIPSVILDVFEISLQLLGLIILSSIIEPYLLIVDGLLLFVFYFIRIVYVETSRNFKRIEAITQSPMYSHMTATMTGLTTIRAFSAQRMLIAQFDKLQDIHSSAWFLYMASGTCFAQWIDFICQVFIACAIFTILSVSHKLHGGDIGLIITQYLCLMSNFQWGVRQWTEMDNNMTSVERILEYTKIETEPAREKIRTALGDWPEDGRIEFRNVSMRYDPSENYVIRNLSFKVRPGEKVGIVGRTGAGKSSTIAALFQLYPLEGSIFIDNVDTTKMPLHVVRSKISIIPQSPFLFTGTMRENLDPLCEYPDDVLWTALEDVDMSEELEELPGGLSSMVSEDGNNFSVGQRQLVCLARALIRKNTILVLDEATANIDPHTDALIQTTIQEKFSHCTILCIAHRLRTVMDADKILVMDEGTVAEYDHPYILLQKKDGILRELVDATGAATAKYLETIAKESMGNTVREMLLNRIFPDENNI
ncbi:unnamed protein product [Phyllotreta striolata]|uniref:Multidrug resistance-associated protein lethal(2)03659 n=1 Tax=Phyllotreta striolata TaxID=444603 RepID=A0A9N9TSP4_PHYSR|nr:unnamed protein product [Phyllotreta striolata]